MEFLCPNGHRIRCPVEQAGRAAKCPRCGVKFRIPNAEDAEAPPASGADSDVSSPELSDSGIGNPATAPIRTRPVQKEPQIEFLCPNGHHLHGAASLQGRAGACPECGSRFRIPFVDGSEEGQPPAEYDSTTVEEPAVAGKGEAVPSEEIIEPAVVAEGSLNSQIELREPEVVPETEPVAHVHPWGALLLELDRRKGDSARIELHLAGGETLTPNRFVRSLSRQDHAVFATKESDGTWTMTAIGWNAIERVLVRGMKSLPDEWAV